MAESANTDNQDLADKKRRALKKVFVIAVAVIAVLAVIDVSVIYISAAPQNSRNEAAQLLLQQIALVEKEAAAGCGLDPCPTEGRLDYIFTDGVKETAETAILKLTKFGFRPDPSVAFHIMPLPDVNGEHLGRSFGFIAFAAHNSVGSKVYVYDDIGGGGVSEVRGNRPYLGINVTGSPPTLFCYTYGFSDSGATVVKKPGSPRIAPDPNDSDACLVVVEAAK